MTQVSKQNNSEVQSPKSKIDALKGIMAAPSVMQQFENVLKENSGAFVASIIDLYNSDTYLQKCDPKAVVFEALKAASLKLPINKSLGHAWIVPFNGVPTFQIGYKGLIQLAMRTGFYKFLNADEVYEGEFVRKNKLTGEFDLTGEAKSDKVIGYFAYLQLTNGFEKTLYMTKAQVEKWGAKYSASYNHASSPWKKEFEKMAIKTVLRNLLNHWGYLSVEMANAMQNDSDYQEDVADQVSDEINEKANRKNMSFEDAEVVDDNGGQAEKTEESGNKSGKPDPAAGMQPQMNF
ncbi:recombinase RecT [Olivibacter sp. 47]|uniref:recombinase RecT n=1 Tax=Olivibacter sp. 47 TaxID=3056486 RepID=UPI0025A33A0E|nr:recombinase RecT [Olivibacter sp. 47]MDM8174761.1 recombinase RecT [Olivibacter sp. 47]